MELSINQFVGSKIKELRKSKGLSQEDMAELLYITQSTFAKIETGVTTLGINRLYFLTTYFKVKPNYFFPRSKPLKEKISDMQNKADREFYKQLRKLLEEKNKKLSELEEEITALKVKEVG